MFHKKKKEYPPGTFIPTPKRVVAILQLCFAFTVMMGALLDPFLTEHYRVRSEEIFYQAVIGGEGDGKAERNRERFGMMSQDFQDNVWKGYKDLFSRANRPWSQKAVEGVQALVTMPLLVLLWMVLAIAISIMLLKKVEGAALAAWLLPFVVFCYGVEVWLGHGKMIREPDAHLFPSEQQLVAEYLTEPLSSGIHVQHQQLKTAWERYLVDHFGEDLESAEHAFNAERLKARMGAQTALASPSLWLMMGYFLWNLFFAFFVSTKVRK